MFSDGARSLHDRYPLLERPKSFSIRVFHARFGFNVSAILTLPEFQLNKIRFMVTIILANKPKR